MVNFNHDEESGLPRRRHMSVSNYAANTPSDGFMSSARRGSSVVPASSLPRGDTQKGAAERERNMGFIEGSRLYPKAMFFSFALSLAVVMEGYDTALLGNFYGVPAFAKNFGQPTGIKNGVQTYGVPAAW
jgi:hypothetical protein